MFVLISCVNCGDFEQDKQCFLHWFLSEQKRPGNADYIVHAWPTCTATCGQILIPYLIPSQTFHSFFPHAFHRCPSPTSLV